MRKQALVLVVLVTLLGTAAKCTEEEAKAGVEIARGALREFGSTTHLRVPKTVTLNDSEISTLAKQADVSDDVIRDVALSLDKQSTWKSSITQLREIYAAVPEEVRSGTISIACDAIQGEYATIDDVAAALYAEFGPANEATVQQIAQSFVDYYYDMRDALAAGDETSAAVTLTCFIAEQAG